MGIEIGLGLAAISMVGGMSEASQAATADRAAIDMATKQKKLEYQQKTMRNNEMVKRVADSQLAEAAGRGYMLASPSFGAMQQEVFRKGGQTYENILTEDKVAMASLEAERENVDNTLYAKLFNLGMSGLSDFNRVASKAPQKSPKSGWSVPMRLTNE